MTQNSINTKNPIVQYLYTSDPDIITCSTIVPNDDTIPQNTEGDEVLTLSITPTNASNYLLIEFQSSIAIPPTIFAAITLFQDATANALSATKVGNTGATVSSSYNVYLRHIMIAGTTSSTTFKIRTGPALAGTEYFNANLTPTKQFAGVSATNLTIMEIKA